MLEQTFLKNIHKASQASDSKIISIRCSCINTKQFLYFVNWYCFGTSQTMFYMHSDFRFALFRGRYKGSKCRAGSSVSSRISWYINLKLIFSIVFVRYNDVHIQQFSIDSKLSKSRTFEKSLLSIVAYGLFITCITSIAFTVKAQHTLGLFAMKIFTMCSDMTV